MRLFETIKCGTVPRAAIVGMLRRHGITADNSVTAHLFDPPDAGTIKTGTWPRPTVVGAVRQHETEITGSASLSVYSVPTTDSKPAGTYPRAAITGSASMHPATSGPEALALVFDTIPCGTRRCGQ